MNIANKIAATALLSMTLNACAQSAVNLTDEEFVSLVRSKADANTMAKFVLEKQDDKFYYVTYSQGASKSEHYRVSIEDLIVKCEVGSPPCNIKTFNISKR